MNRDDATKIAKRQLDRIEAEGAIHLDSMVDELIAGFALVQSMTTPKPIMAKTSTNKDMARSHLGIKTAEREKPDPSLTYSFAYTLSHYWHKETMEKTHELVEDVLVPYWRPKDKSLLQRMKADIEAKLKANVEAAAERAKIEAIIMAEDRITRDAERASNANPLKEGGLYGSGNIYGVGVFQPTTDQIAQVAKAIKEQVNWDIGLSEPASGVTTNMIHEIAITSNFGK